MRSCFITLFVLIGACLLLGGLFGVMAASLFDEALGVNPTVAAIVFLCLLVPTLFVMAGPRGAPRLHRRMTKSSRICRIRVGDSRR
ncbi:hypothetical protein JW916_12340 [Candidatus Sumerlaeota bacterium]|nr:hypothetical protein [Candidatus Sumerlaeota bacterium]